MELESEDGTTIADIIRNCGLVYLERKDGVMKLKPNIGIQAGKYSLIPAQQQERLGENPSESKKRKLDLVDELNNSTSNERVLEFFN